MKIQLTASRYKLLAHYCEDLSKAIALSNVIGFFLPSVLPSALLPSTVQLAGGVLTALTSWQLF